MREEIGIISLVGINSNLSGWKQCFLDVSGFCSMPIKCCFHQDGLPQEDLLPGCNAILDPLFTLLDASLHPKFQCVLNRARLLFLVVRMNCQQTEVQSAQVHTKVCFNEGCVIVHVENLNAPSADDRLRRVDREVKAFGRLRPCSRFAPLPTPPAAPLLERSRDPGPGAVFGRFAPGEFS